MERCLDFFLHQRQLDEKNLVTEQKVRQQITQTTQITPKLIKKKLLTIIVFSHITLASQVHHSEKVHYDPQKEPGNHPQ